MQITRWTDQEVGALRDMMIAVTLLLECLATANTEAERAALVTDFDASIMQLRDVLVKQMRCGVAAADDCLVRILTHVAAELAVDPVER